MAQEPPKINILLHAQTDIGMVRHGNEDNFLVVDLSTAETWTVENSAEPPNGLLSFSQGHYGSLIAVSDGMGGALAGEVASQMACSAVRDRMLQFQATPAFSQFAFNERLRLAIEQANVLINAESQNNVEYTGMGATFTAAGLDGEVAYLAQVGDSRCYLIRQGKIAQVTKDQSLVSQLVEAGHITEEEAEQHTYKNVILQALGAQPRVNVIVDRVRLRRNDIFLLCSDGLSGKVKGPEMLKIVQETPDIKTACDQLIKLANERGGEDNITVLIAKFDGEGLQDPSPEDPYKGEFIPRDPNLPDEVDPASLVIISDDETLRPDEAPLLAKKAAAERERVDVVETQEVQATMLNMPAVTPQMLAEHAASQMSSMGESPVSVSTSAAATAAPSAIPSPSLDTNSNARMSAASMPEAEAETKGSGRSIFIIVTILVVLLVGAFFAYQRWKQAQSANPATGAVAGEAIQAGLGPISESDKQRSLEEVKKVERKADRLISKVEVWGSDKAEIKDQVRTTLQDIKYNLANLEKSAATTSYEEVSKKCQGFLEQLAEIEKKHFTEAEQPAAER